MALCVKVRCSVVCSTVPVPKTLHVVNQLLDSLHWQQAFSPHRGLGLVIADEHHRGKSTDLCINIQEAARGMPRMSREVTQDPCQRTFIVDSEMLQ